MTRFNKTSSFTFIISVSFILLSFLVYTYCAAQETKSAPAQRISQAPPSQTGNASMSSQNANYKTIPISMEMEAGSDKFKIWPGGKVTIHAGIGWIHPFGRGEYVAGEGYPEAEKYPMPSYFNEEWMKTYNTRLFCIYMLKDGNIYAYDGVVGNLEPEVADDDGKMDYLINVIVGGTGAYEGATGILVGRTPGRGKSKDVGGGIGLPVSILKLMDGYINIPIKKVK